MKETAVNRFLYTFLAGGIGLILIRHLGNATGFGLILLTLILLTIAVLIKYMWYGRA